MPHTHTVPTFGCEDCIAADRENWAEQTYSEWKKTYKLPKCPGCGATMIHYGRNTYPSKLDAIVICPTMTADGDAICEDHDIVVVIG